MSGKTGSITSVITFYSQMKIFIKKNVKLVYERLWLKEAKCRQWKWVSFKQWELHFNDTFRNTFLWLIIKSIPVSKNTQDEVGSFDVMDAVENSEIVHCIDASPKYFLRSYSDRSEETWLETSLDSTNIYFDLIMSEIIPITHIGTSSDQYWLQNISRISHAVMKGNGPVVLLTWISFGTDWELDS